MNKFCYHTNCIGSNGGSIRKMVESSKKITFSTFVKNCDSEDIKTLAAYLGYACGKEKGLHLKDDCMVTYYKSEYNGKTCYYMSQSAIEYIFLR